MAGKGKYTEYAPKQGDSKTLLKKLFGTNAGTGDGVGTLPPQMVVDPGKEGDALAAIVAIARAVLTPVKQQGDHGYFPDGVKLDFSDSPITEKVGHAAAGDPANPYMPDITSPGPGKTDGSDKVADPKIAPTDIKPNYVAKSGGTASPADTRKKIIEGNTLGESGKMGSSDGKAT